MMDETIANPFWILKAERDVVSDLADTRKLNPKSTM